jgi:hypothetical protein
MSRNGISNQMFNDDRIYSTSRVDSLQSNQLTFFDLWEDKLDDGHETTYQLFSPYGEIIELTFTTNDPSAFNQWCIDEGLNPEKIHAIADEGLNSAHKEWFVKKIDNPVEESEPEPEPIVEEKPKKTRRKRRTKEQIAVDKANAEVKPRAKKPIKVLEIGDKVEDKLPEPIFDEDHAQDQVIAQIFTEEPIESKPTNRKQRRAAKKRKRR